MASQPPEVINTDQTPVNLTPRITEVLPGG